MISRCRPLLPAVAIFLCFAASARADDPGRYALSPSRDGFVRLDTATGAASHCRPEKGIWRCEPMTVEANRIDALTAEVAALTAKVAALNGRSGAVPPAPVAAPATAKSNLINEAMVRFLDLVRALKHGRDS